jgi:nucleoside-diphosphate-sugar epimerase/2-polyprenyl-3-methyl-5-hydroxy-6-metoxy-1,4-benzoquinol methylase/dTDP-4-dehydrorhamnose 3,5-epimerase-like enzyme
MIKNIIITGGLGYLGTELCKIYSGISWKYKITVIDNKFISERVNQLHKWGIEFIQGDILDKNFLQEIIPHAHTVHHLAGITDVAYTKSEKNFERDKLIKSTAIEGTSNILYLMSKNAKIIFPSTHVIFDGLKKSKTNLDEQAKPCPILAYSASKYQNEIDIKKSERKFIILRLGSVYGYSGDATRINIMPNLFSKMASQNQKLKLFGGGKQLKSLVPLVDVARCFKFMEENNILNETFNLTKENTSVKKVALICKKYKPNLQVEITNDEIPNPGYTLSNKKLLKTGFVFLYSLEKGIEEMIKNWSLTRENFLEKVEVGTDKFLDKRGCIDNFKLPEPINLIGLITSKAGTMRANHFHPIQEQKCLVVKGQFISILQDLIDKKSIKFTQIVNEGEITVTRPNVAHAMVFTKDTTFLNLVRGEREHKNYGITHTIPYQLVDNNQKKELIDRYKLNCRVCSGINLKRFISFGFTALANNLLKKKHATYKKYPLELNYCSECYNVQLSYSVNPKELFLNYNYLSSTAKPLKNHFENAAIEYKKKFKLSKKSIIIDVGSNDGIALKPFKKLGLSNVIGIEPASNLSKLSNMNGIKTINDFLNKKILNKIKTKADLILASNVFAHTDDIDEMTECMKELLKDSGTIVIEIQYLLNTLKDLTFDNIYHEHVNYWSLHSLKTYFEKFNLSIIDSEKINTHGGSLRIYVKKKQKNVKISKNILKILNEEKKYGINKFKTFEKFAKSINKIKYNVQNNIKKLSEKYKNLYGYGCPAKAATALNFFGIGKYIKEIIEDNPLKIGKYLPDEGIKVISKNILFKKVDCIIVLAWNYFDDIKKNNQNLSKKIINIKLLESKNPLL